VDYKFRTNKFHCSIFYYTNNKSNVGVSMDSKFWKKPSLWCLYRKERIYNREEKKVMYTHTQGGGRGFGGCHNYAFAPAGQYLIRSWENAGKKNEL